MFFKRDTKAKPCLNVQIGFLPHKHGSRFGDMHKFNILSTLSWIVGIGVMIVLPMFVDSLALVQGNHIHCYHIGIALLDFLCTGK